MTSLVYYNGKLIPRSEAAVSIDDGGWLHGAGLFETMRAENGRLFRLASHIERLRKSAAVLLRPIGQDQLPSAAIWGELLEGNGLKLARVRLTVSAGSMLTSLGDDAFPFTICATATPLGAPPAKLYTSGVRVKLSSFRVSPSDPIAGHKTTAYLPRLLSLREAQRAQCLETIWFTTQSHLAEGSISNVFLVHQGVLKTPPTDTPVLPGITRGIILALSEETGIETREEPLSVDDLLDADEVFLTNAIMQVMPVIGVEKHTIGDGTVGPISRRLLQNYRDLLRKECADR